MSSTPAASIVICFAFLAILLITVLSIYFVSRRPAPTRERVLVCFLTRKLTTAYAKTVDLLCRDIPYMSACIIVDEEDDEDENATSTLHNAVKVVVSEKDCLQKFYTGLNWFKPVCAWEKCLYALNYTFPETELDFRHAWIIEDDVSFASPASFKAILDNHGSSDADLIATHIETQSDSPGWCNWHYGENYFHATAQTPLHKSFNVVMRISKALLAACDKCIQIHRRAAFLELFFINVCVQSKYVYKNAKELQPHLFYVLPDEHYLQRTGAPVVHPCKDLHRNLLQLQG